MHEGLSVEAFEEFRKGLPVGVAKAKTIAWSKPNMFLLTGLVIETNRLQTQILGGVLHFANPQFQATRYSTRGAELLKRAFGKVADLKTPLSLQT